MIWAFLFGLFILFGCQKEEKVENSNPASPTKLVVPVNTIDHLTTSIGSSNQNEKKGLAGKFQILINSGSGPSSILNCERPKDSSIVMFDYASDQIAWQKEFNEAQTYIAQMPRSHYRYLFWKTTHKENDGVLHFFSDSIWLGDIDGELETQISAELERKEVIFPTLEEIENGAKIELPAGWKAEDVAYSTQCRPQSGLLTVLGFTEEENVLYYIYGKTKDLSPALIALDLDTSHIEDLNGEDYYRFASISKGHLIYQSREDILTIVEYEGQETTPAEVLIPAHIHENENISLVYLDHGNQTLWVVSTGRQYPLSSSIWRVSINTQKWEQFEIDLEEGVGIGNLHVFNDSLVICKSRREGDILSVISKTNGEEIYAAPNDCKSLKIYENSDHNLTFAHLKNDSLYVHDIYINNKLNTELHYKAVDLAAFNLHDVFDFELIFLE